MTEASSNHPGDEALLALSLGQLTEAELALVSVHLGECPACCQRIDQLATGDRLLARLQESAGSQAGALVTPDQRRPAVRALRQASDSKHNLRRPSADLVPVILPAPRQVGDYHILAEVGRGGMGVVYKAQHQRLHRLAALKMILAGQFASPAQQIRFRLEAELAARVQHPNIVQVYEIGSNEGRPFLALEWVEGGSLANRLDGKPWPPNEAAALIEALARAIDVAHSEGVVHRDLKPGNVLLQKAERREEGEKRKEKPSEKSGDSGSATDYRLLTTDYTPKIVDFGLAQTIDGGRTMTQSGFLVGTPGYMSPEQAAGKRALVGPATDIYALGVMLYQLLTGQMPFQSDSTLELLRKVTTEEPARPRRLQPRLPLDLEAIALHCLEKEPGRRYPSALALAEDLQRFREGKQVVARPVGAAARLVRTCRRRPLVSTLVVLLIVSVFGGFGGVTWKWLEADAEKHAALFQAYRASLAAAGAALHIHDVADAGRHLQSAPEELQGWEWRHLQSRLDDSSSVVPVAAGGGYLIAGPDQLRVGVLTSAGLRFTDLEGGVLGTLRLGPEAMRVASANLQGTDRRRCISIAQTSRGLRVAAWVGNTAFDLLDETGQVHCRVEPRVREPGPVALSPDGMRLACSTEDAKSPSQITIFDATSGKPTALCDAHQNGVWGFTFSPDGTRLASCTEDGTAHVWDAANGALLATCKGHTSKVLGVAFSPDGSRLVTASSDRTVRQWDAKTGLEVEPPYDRHSGEVLTAVYSPDGQWVASAGSDRTVRVWRARGRHDLAVLQGHTGGVIQVAFSPDGRRLASLSCATGQVSAWDATVRVWDVDPNVSLSALRGHTSWIYPVAYSPDGRWLASGSWDKTVRLWDAATGELCATLPHPSFVFDLAFGPDGSWLVIGGPGYDRLRIWDVATARIRNEFPLPGGVAHLHALTVSPDGTRVAVEAQDRWSHHPGLIVFDIASSQQIYSTEGAPLAYSPDGRWLAALAADEKTVLLLDARTHETIAQFRGHESRVHKGAFSPDSRLLATCGRDHSVRVWSVELAGNSVKGSLPVCRVLSGHTDEVYAMAFHPDGKRLATAGRDRAVWLWDVASGKGLLRLPGHEDYVWSLSFSPDGTTLASGSGDKTVRLWGTAPLKTRYQASREAAALRPEADRLVEQLWGEKHDAAKVVEALRADPVLSEALRHAALRAVLRRVQPQETAPGQPPERP